MNRRVLGKSTTLLGGGRKKQSLNHSYQEFIHGKDQIDEVKRSHGRVANSTPWVPHPRTGIYYPKGHEWVMEDVPIGASSFPQAYWLRNSEVVEKPSSNVSHSDVFDHPFLNN